MKKTLALLLALVLCLGVLAGCQEAPVETTTEPSSSATGGTEGSTSTSEPAYTFEGKTLDYWLPKDYDGCDAQKFMEEALGLDLEYVYAEENTLIASFTDKVTPSLFFSKGINNAFEYGRYGLYVNFYDYKDIMPNFFARYEQYGDEIKARFELEPGELYIAPNFSNGYTEHQGWIYRQDIFEELKLEIPTTWQEFLDVCAALKKAYPDSYPFTARNFTNMSFFQRFGNQFGNRWNWGSPALNDAEDAYYNPFTTDSVRDMLTKIRELIDLGYMDIAALSYDTAKWVESMSASKSFITYDKTWQLDSIEKAGQEVDPDFKLYFWHNFPVYDTVEYYQCCRALEFEQFGYSVTTKCADVELAIRTLDWMYSDEGSEILSWGKEGVSFEVAADGSKNFIAGYDDDQKAIFTSYHVCPYIDFEAKLQTYAPTTREFQLSVQEATAGGRLNDPSLAFTDEENDIIKTYKSDWTNTYLTYWQNFLLGKLKINDDNWNKFKTDMAAFHEDELIAAYNAAYKRYLEG